MTDYCQDFSRFDQSQRSKCWRKSIGAIGEAIASSYLQQSGWCIERRGFRHGRASGEADLIAIDSSGVKSVIEVKTRSFRFGTRSTWYESAVQAIDYEKRRRLIKLTQRFHSFFDPDTPGYRLDVILIGIQTDLVFELIESRRSNSSPEFFDLVSTATKEFLEGDDLKLQIIHCQEAFVTKS